MIAFFLLLWLIPIAANVLADRNGRKPNYLVMFILRGMAAILHGVLFEPDNFGEYFPVLVFQVTSFWLIFEATLNYLREKPLLYYDTVEKDSGYIDRFFAWAGNPAHTIAKVCTLILCILSIIVIYARS
jgi:hypothetical protein